MNGSPMRAHPALSELDLAVFRSGDYGARGRYTNDDLDRLAADYDPTTHEAPLTIDHEERGPAHGWVRELRREGDLLVARIVGMSRFIRGALTNGTYRKPSVELFTRHPVTGERRLGLRAVSLLGSMVPRVKGLPALGFSELSELLAQTGGGAGGDDETDAIGTTLVLPAPSALMEPAVGLHDAPGEWGVGAAGDVLESGRAEERIVGDRPGAEKIVADATIAGDAKEDRAASVGSRSTFAEREPLGVARPATGEALAALRRDGAYLPAWDRLGVPEFIAWLEGGAPDDAIRTFAEQENDTPARWFARFLRQVRALRLEPIAPIEESDTRVFAARTSSSPGATRPRLPNAHALADLSPQSVVLHDRAVRRLRAEPGLTYSEALRQESAASPL
jgi:hypothetical protein